MQGASPLASPRLNPGDTGTGAAYRALAGGLPRRCQLTLPSLSPAGARRLGLPLCPAFSFVFAPIPPTPFPAGRGRFLVDFAGGFAPGTPAAEPIGLRKTDKKRSLRVIPPPTEAPVRQGQPVPRPVQPWGCKGRSPLHEITLNPPFPAGEERSASAGRGDRGQKRTLKAGQGGTPNRRAPRWGQRRQGHPATPGQAPPPARDTSPLLRCRPGSAPGDARGEAPCMK